MPRVALAVLGTLRGQRWGCWPWGQWGWRGHCGIGGIGTAGQWGRGHWRCGDTRTGGHRGDGSSPGLGTLRGAGDSATRCPCEQRWPGLAGHCGCHRAVTSLRCHRARAAQSLAGYTGVTPAGREPRMPPSRGTERHGRDVPSVGTQRGQAGRDGRVDVGAGRARQTPKSVGSVPGPRGTGQCRVSLAACGRATSGAGDVTERCWAGSGALPGRGRKRGTKKRKKKCKKI